MQARRDALENMNDELRRELMMISTVDRRLIGGESALTGAHMCMCVCVCVFVCVHRN
jgi:hypothetical protein